MGVFFIELINYVEHYGLDRKKDERVQYFSVGKHTDQLVYWVFFMDQLMACKAVYTTQNPKTP